MPQSSPKERQHIRYARLTSAFGLMLGVLCLLTFPMSAINPPNPITPYIQGIALLSIVLSVILGKAGWQHVAASLIISSSMIGVVGTMISNPLDPIFVPTFFLLVIPVIMASAMMPPIASLVTGGIGSGIVVAITVFQHHTAYYDAQMKLGFYSETVSVPMLTIVVVAIVSYVIMRNLMAAIYRADRAEEILHLQEEVAAFQREQQRNQQMLQEGVMLIAQIHSLVANGDFAARVPLEVLGNNSPLWPVAVPLNNLLSRVQHWKYDSEHLERVQVALIRLVQDLNTARRSQAPLFLSSVSEKELEPLCFELQAINQTFP
jgi:hypothetical protein